MKTVITYLVFVALAAMVCVFGFIGILWWFAIVSVLIFFVDFMWPYLRMKYYLWRAKSKINSVLRYSKDIDAETIDILKDCVQAIDEISNETKV